MKSMILNSVAVFFLLAPVSLRADNLADDSSSIAPRIQESGKILVDAGLIYLLNKYARSAGSDQAAIQTLKKELETLNRELQTASENLAKFGPEAERALKKVQEMGARFDAQSNVDIDHRRYGESSRAWRRVGGNGEYTGPRPARYNAGLFVSDKEMSAAEKAARQLLLKRDQAVQLIDELPAKITGATEQVRQAEQAGHHADRVARGWKVVRVAGNVVLGLDLAGHGWAFYENSKTPVFMGGVYRLHHGLEERPLFTVIDRRAKPTAPVTPPLGQGERQAQGPDVAPAPRENVDVAPAPHRVLPRRATVNVPAHLPPLQAKAPELP